MQLNRYIDHTLLRPDIVPDDVIRLCREAIDFDFYAVVVNPIHISRAAEVLEKTKVQICSVVGFPLGASHPEIKVAEAVRAEGDGADEIDLVANIGWIQSRQCVLLAEELTAVREALRSQTTLKVIIETPLTKPEYWPQIVEIIIQSGADFVKTATGFFGGTPAAHVRQLSEYCRGRIGIKAAGGIRSAAGAMDMIAAGASRIGTSSAVAIMKETQGRLESDS